jgi:hypothetical protein
MTTKEKQIKIAEWMGLSSGVEPPDYFNDLNAIYEVIFNLPFRKKINLVDILRLEFGITCDVELLTCRAEDISEALGICLELWE